MPGKDSFRIDLRLKNLRLSKKGVSMIKKVSLVVGLTGLILAAMVSCGRQAKAPQAGKANIMDLVGLLPENTQGVLAWDVHRALTTAVAHHSLEDKEIAAKIQEFKEKTGIDPEKDVFLIVGGMIARPDSEPSAVALLNLRYDKEKILSLIREKNPEIGETSYGRAKIYTFPREKRPEPGLAFYDASNIFIGEIEAVKAVIDVCEKKAKNLTNNAELNALIKAANREALFWGTLLLPAEAMAELAKSNAMLASLQHLRALTMSFDYKNKSLLAEIKAMGADESQNKQIADLITGMKAMGAMAATKYPEVVEVFNRLEVGSSPQSVSLKFTLPEELMIKLGDRMKQEVGANLPKLQTKEN